MPTKVYAQLLASKSISPLKYTIHHRGNTMKQDNDPKHRYSKGRYHVSHKYVKNGGTQCHLDLHHIGVDRIYQSLVRHNKNWDRVKSFFTPPPCRCLSMSHLIRSCNTMAYRSKSNIQRDTKINSVTYHMQKYLATCYRASSINCLCGKASFYYSNKETYMVQNT